MLKKNEVKVVQQNSKTSNWVTWKRGMKFLDALWKTFTSRNWRSRYVFLLPFWLGWSRKKICTALLWTLYCLAIHILTGKTSKMCCLLGKFFFVSMCLLVHLDWYNKIRLSTARATVEYHQSIPDLALKKGRFFFQQYHNRREKVLVTSENHMDLFEARRYKTQGLFSSTALPACFRLLKTGALIKIVINPSFS